jgi:hypothetical protein
MLAIQTGQLAPAGVYLSLRHVDMQVVSGAERYLRGLPGATYKRLPLVAVVVLGPIIGGLFAMGLPLIILAAFTKAVFEYISKFRTYQTGESVRWGVYLGLTRPGVAHVGATGEKLRGHEGVRYLRIPTLLVVVLSPLLGLLYVILFPAILAVAAGTVMVQLVVSAVTGRTPTASTWPFSGELRDEDDEGNPS